MHPRRTTSSRHGSAVFESLLVTPVLLLVLVAALEFGMAAITQATINHAATVGAREAGKGATIAQVAATVDVVLDAVDLNTSTPGVRIFVEDETQAPPDDVQSYGDATMTYCDPPATPVLGAGEVRVTVCVDLDAAPVLSAKSLSLCGFDLSGGTDSYFRASALVNHE